MSLYSCHSSLAADRQMFDIQPVPHLLSQCYPLVLDRLEVIRPLVDDKDEGSNLGRYRA